jgi:RNA 2',3'-cyclic 3'-phosphodiesterase
MRVFVAVELGEAVRERAARVSRALAAALEQGRDRRGVAWVAPHNLHLTLRFLGEIDAAALEAVKGRLAPPFAAPPFEVALSGLGTFPSSGPPRVVWLGVGDGAKALSGLYREVDERLAGLGLPREARGFHAHLTLGRIKAPVGPRLLAAMTKSGAADAGRCLVDHVTLFESRLSPSGATYSVVGTSRLGYHHTT